MTRRANSIQPRPMGTSQRRAWRPSGMSLGELARRTGIDRSYLARIFNRKRRPSLRVMRLLAKALHLTIEALLRKLGC